MSSFVTLELKTAPPVVSFGPIAGATVGQVLTVDYTADAPCTAILRLSNGSVLAVMVTAEQFSVLLPNVAAGGAVLEVIATDDVGNSATEELAFLILPRRSSPAPFHLPRQRPLKVKDIKLKAKGSVAASTNLEVHVAGSVAARQRLAITIPGSVAAVKGLVLSVGGTVSGAQDLVLLAGGSSPRLTTAERQDEEILLILMALGDDLG